MTPAQLARALSRVAPSLRRAILAQLAAWRNSAARVPLAAVEAAIARGDVAQAVRLVVGDAVADAVVLTPPPLPDAGIAFATGTPAAIAAASRTEQAIVRAAAEAARQASALANAALPPRPPSVPVPGIPSVPPPLSGVLTAELRTTTALTTEAASAVRYGGEALRYLRAEARAGIVAAVRDGIAAGVNPRDVARGLRDVVGLGESQAQWVANLRTQLELGPTVPPRGTLSGFDRALRRDLLNGPIRQTVAAAARKGEPLTSAQIDRIVAGYADKWRAWHAETVSRTLSLDLLRTGTLERAKAAQRAGLYGSEPLTKRWVTRLDGRERDAHRLLNGVTIPLDAAWLDDGVSRQVPGGWNCYVGDTVVASAPRLLLRSWYDGPVVQLVLAGGAQLTVTPNHPILTTEGFASAGSLNQSHDVLCDGISVGGPAPAPPADGHDEDGPSSIEQVWHALVVDRPVFTSQLVREDLHGDARRTDGDVQIVVADRQLLDDLQASRAQAFGNGRLEGMHSHQPLLARLGSPNAALQRVRVATAGRVGARDLSDTPISVHPRPLQPFSVGPASDFDTSATQAQFNCAPARSELLGKRLQRLAGLVGANDGRFIQGDAVHGFVPQRVASVEQRWHTGWVYDTMTASGLQSANNLVVSNCRCALVIRVGV